MSDLFKSAFGYFSNNSAANPTENDFVGQIVEIGSVQLRVKKTIAEGGFAFVFIAQALDTGKEYALKRLLAADEEARQLIIQEINILKKLSGHPNIIKFVAATFVDKAQTGHGMGEFLLLTELCTGGSLVAVLQRLNGRGFPPDVVAKVMWQCCKAVHHMHSQSPPVIHRDLKIENLLIGDDNKIRLCDFGSATSQVFRPDNSWSSQQRSMLEDKIFKCTTPMYRAPEMVDTWSNHEIGAAADMWALGCLLYLMCFNKHPFEDSSNLRIINANYSIPQGDAKYKCFHNIISGCLNVQPGSRLTITQILDRLAAVSETLRINPSDPIEFNKFVPSNPIPVPNASPSNSSPVHQVQSTPPNGGTARSQSPAQRPPVYTHAAPTPAQAPSAGGGLFSSIKGGAGSFLKNLKDTSSKVVQSVSQLEHPSRTMAKSEEMAASYITSRLCVINYTEGPDTLHDLRFTVESRHSLPSSAIYNLSSAPLPTQRFPNATIVECGWGKKCPSLQALYTLCEHMHHFLSSHPSNVCFIICNDGKRSSPLLVAGFLLFVGFVKRPTDALQLYAVKRTPPNLQPSHLRYLDYFTQILENPQPTLTCHKIRIMSIIMEPVPVFNKNRDGCRPYVDIFQGEDKVFTTIDEYDRMITFNHTHGKVVLPVRCSVAGDITIVVNHARQVLTRITPLPMLRIQFNSAFTHDSVMMLSRGDLDDIDSDHFHDRFLVTINCEEAGDPNVSISPWAKHKAPSSGVIFSTKQEADEITESFVSKGKPAMQRPPPPRPAPPRPPPANQLPPSPQNSTSVNNTSDLLNLGINNVSAAGPPPQHKPAVETDDLLNLSFDSAPASNFNNKPEPAPFSSETPFFSDMSAPPVAEKVANNTGNLLGDWDAGSSNFADFGSPNVTSTFQNLNLDGGVGLDPTSSSQPAQSNQFLGGFPNAGNIQRNVSSPNLHSDLFEELITKPPKAVSNASSPSKTPSEANYSRSHFEAAKPPPSVNPSKKMEDAFGDLLGSQGYTFTAKKDSGPKTINEMRREDQVKVVDPEKLKVMDWSEGKKSNIRALLTSLHTILWPDSKWNQVYMHQMVNPADVKKIYRKACIAVHPDKHMGTPNETLAKLIFMELNNAWNDFEKELG